MTIGELKERLEELHDEDGSNVDDGSTVRVLMPGGKSVDVMSVAAYDAAAQEKGEKFIGLRPDVPA